PPRSRKPPRRNAVVGVLVPGSSPGSRSQCSVFDHAVSEIVLLGVGAHILEGRDGDRRLVRQRQTGAGRPVPAMSPATRETRIGRAMFFRVRSPLSLKARSSWAAAPSCPRGYTDATRLRQGFEPGRDVDPAA